MIRGLISVLLWALIILAPAALGQNAAIGLSWNASTDNVGVAGYNVYRNGTKIGTTPSTSYTDNTATPHTQYNYSVSAFDAAGNESAKPIPVMLFSGGPVSQASGDLAFSLPNTDVLHYIAATGCSDANNGTSTSTPWCTPNHALNCGDVIIVAPGTYGPGSPVANPFHRTFPTPTNCPSTTGGIDGTGGIYFAILLCNGDLSSSASTGCIIQGNGDQNGGASVEFYFDQSNWAVSGFYFDTQCVNTGVPGNCSRSFQNRNDTVGSKVHHIALINSVVVNSMQAFGGNDGGNAGNTDHFSDYKAAVGVIAWNSSQNGDYQGGIRVAAIDFTDLGSFDANPGTHVYAYNNYVILSKCPACNSDSEAFMSDSPDVHNFAGQIVYSNNIAYQSDRACIQATFNGGPGNNPLLNWYMYNNTCYGNNLNVSPASGGGEFDTAGNGSSANFSFLFYNNIMMPATATSAGGSIPIYAAVVGGETWLSWKEGTAVNASGQNVLFGFQGACGSGCAPPGGAFTAATYFNSNPIPTSTQNYYVNPAFQNISDLISNHIGAPNCSGFINTTACMGWNANTQALTTNSVIYDLQATCANCTGKGFQSPSTTCITIGTANTVVADYPTWLKAVVYLHWTGSSIVRKADLATLPCGY